MRRTLALLALLASLAILTAACGQATTTQDASTDADESEQPANSAEHDHTEPDRDSEPAAEPSATSTTAATIAQMQALDPAMQAAAHDHHGDHQATDEAHPNGVVPERIVIPAIGVDADVIELGLQGDGSMEVPSDFAQTGWFAPGPPPGRVGPAVIAGHVDSRSGPAVFYRLRDLAPGDLIEVHGEDGQIVTFAVRETEQHPKNAFPTDKVYAGTAGPELRLITCGGDFDAEQRSYRDNVVVYAERVTE